MDDRKDGGVSFSTPTYPIGGRCYLPGTTRQNTVSKLDGVRIGKQGRKLVRFSIPTDVSLHGLRDVTCRRSH